jgi:DNA-binding transcriptional regulator YiaG
MASSDFWRDLTTEFQKLPDYWTLSAEWKNYGGGGPGTWSLSGSNAAKYSFEALASRAGREIAKKGTPDLLTAWLDQLKQEDVGFKPMAFAVIQNPDGRERQECQAGHFPRVCEASVYFCRKLETRAVHLEAEWSEEDRKNLRAFANRAMEDLRQNLKSKSERLKELSDTPSQPKAVEPKTESVGEQLRRLRDECHITAQELAELIDVEVRSVQRHLAGDSIPYDRHLRAYEREFSKLLNRKVVISKLS